MRHLPHVAMSRFVILTFTIVSRSVVPLDSVLLVLFFLDRAVDLLIQQKNGKDFS